MKLIITAILLTAAAFAQSAPRFYSNDGKGLYLGKLSTNTWDPDSISNSWGQYGNSWSPNSVNNTWGTYGSAWSPYSARNSWATSAPIIVGTPLVTMPTFGSLPSLPALPSLSTKCCSDWSW